MREKPNHHRSGYSYLEITIRDEDAGEPSELSAKHNLNVTLRGKEIQPSIQSRVSRASEIGVKAATSIR